MNDQLAGKIGAISSEPVAYLVSRAKVRTEIAFVERDRTQWRTLEEWWDYDVTTWTDY